MAKIIGRRTLLKNVAIGTAGALLAGCAPKVIKETVVVEKEVEKVVKQTVVVEKEKEVTKVVEKQVEKIVTAQPANAGTVTLQYWMAWGADAAKTFNDMNELQWFKDAMGDVKLSVTPSMDMQKLMTAVASGSGPDGASNLPYPELYARGAVLPVTDYINASPTIKQDDFIEANWTGAQYKGDFWGVPACECFVRYALCIDKIRWEEAGLDANKLPQTWAEVFEAHKKVTKFDAAGNIEVMGLNPYENMGGSVGYGNPWMIPASWGFKYWDEVAQKHNIDVPEMVDAWKVLTEFYKHMGPEKVAGFRQAFTNWGPAFRQGIQVMIIDGYWNPGGCFKNNPERPKMYTWLPVPDARKGKKIQVAGGHYVVLPTVAVNPDLMYKAAELFTTPEAADWIFEQRAWLPARKSYLAAKDVSRYPGLDWYVKSVVEADELGAIAVDPITSFVADTWYRLREKVYFGEMTAEAAVTEMQQECEKALADVLAG